MIQKNHCSPLGVYAQGQGPYPAVIPTILSQPTSGSVTLFTDSSCSTPVVGYTNFNFGNYIEFYVLTSAVVTGSFIAQVGTTATGWQNPSVTYTPVNDRLGMTAATPSINTNTCTSISLTNYADNTNTGSGTLGSLRLSAHSNNDSNTPPAVQVYSNGSNCSTQTSPIASTMVESSKVFNIGTFGTTSGIVYVRSNTGEQIHFSLSRTTNDAEPAGTSITFIPYSLGTIPGPNLTGATYGGGTLNIPFNSGTETVPTKIQIGSSDCVITSRTSAAIQCTIPYSPPGFFPLNIFVGSMQFYSGYSYEYRTTVSTFAGTAGVSGSLDATGLSSKFFGASGAALNPMNGDLYVADTGNHIIRKITSAGVVTTLAGLANVSGSTDSTGSAARFNYPMGLALHGSYLYVADKMNHKIRRIDVNTAVVTTLAGTGSSGSGSFEITALSATFDTPTGITVNPSNGDLYISDTMNHKIRKFNASNSMVSTVSGNGSPGNSNGTLVASTYNSPMGIAFDPTTQNLYVAEAMGHRIRKLELLNSMVSVFAGSPSTPVPGWVDGSSIFAQFNGPRGVAVDSLGNVFVADSGNNLIRRIDPSGFVYTVAGNASAGYADGLGHVSTFTLPSALVSNTPTSLTIIDTNSYLVRKINW